MMLKKLHVDYMTDTYVYQEALTSLKDLFDNEAGGYKAI